MGEQVQTARFERRDFARFTARLAEETRLLSNLFREQRFSEDGLVGGFELEAWLVDKHFRPAPVNDRLLSTIDDPLVVPELAASNIEFNGSPLSLRGNALTLMLKELAASWRATRSAAAKLDTELVTVGILPSAREQDLTLDTITDRPRYRALNEQVLHRRGGRPMDIRIRGRDALRKTQSDVMLEAATTSFQVHLQVPPKEAVRFYNASLIAAAPLVAATANSPYLFGRDLWQETRIPVFEQGVDLGRNPHKRVSLGTGYAKDDLLGCFHENLLHHPALLPIDCGSDISRLAHVQLHNGTIWRWVRPLVGFDGDRPQLRIEQRVIPAGPTLVDCVANAALSWALTTWLARGPAAPEGAIPFGEARRNLYRAARLGLGAHILWVNGRYRRLQTLLLELMPELRSTLVECGLDYRDVDFFLEIIEQRLRSGRTGADWQRRWARRYGDRTTELTRAYLERQADGQAVHCWNI